MNTTRYSGGRLDRNANQRKDQDWLRAQQKNTLARFLPLWSDRSAMVFQEGVPQTFYLEQLLGQSLLEQGVEWVFLGIEDGAPLFALDFSHLAESELSQLVQGATFEDLRKVGPLLSWDDAANHAYARAMLYWHRNHRFCGRCGAPSRSACGGHVRVCESLDCKKETFPRTDPAVIMLVEDRPTDGSPARCLLGRHQRSPEGQFSTLAGFVEPGERLEDAVAREVFEEAGVIVSNATYQTSQAWPFPASLMVGFRAQAETTEIQIDPHELSEAAWFTAETLRQAGDWGDPGPGLKLSRRDSISHWLIQSWLAEQS